MSHWTHPCRVSLTQWNRLFRRPSLPRLHSNRSERPVIKFHPGALPQMALRHPLATEDYRLPRSLSLADSERWCLNPFYDVTITVLGVMTGLVGLLFSAEIKSLFSGWGTFSYPALAFWSLLILFSCLFFFKHKATHIAQGKLIRQTESLEVLIKTLPPDGFLTDFARIYNLSHQAALKPFSKQSSSDGKSIIENIEHAIRTILDGIVTLTRTFDSKPHDVVYAANIMLYKNITDLSDAEIKEISKNVLLVEEGFDLKTLEGLLGLQVNLSTITETDKPEPDAELREFYLPIPINKKLDDGKRYKYLPGAPLAFIENTMNVNSDSSSLCRWCQDSGDFLLRSVKMLRIIF